MSERRFTEEEVAAIFERAAESQQGQRRHLPASEGMTLAQLQEIGREVGLPAELVARAAQSIDAGGTPTARTFLGLPIGVGRTIELPRRLSDDEWERLVVDLRETFDARGTVRSEGSLRQWTNGNLQALLEPTATGHRLRLKTIKGDARAYMSAGLAMLGFAGVSFGAAALRGAVSADPGMVSSMGLLASMGVAMFAAGALRLPSWARLRRRQMEEVATRLALTTESPSRDDPRIESK